MSSVLLSILQILRGKMAVKREEEYYATQNISLDIGDYRPGSGGP